MASRSRGLVVLVALLSLGLSASAVSAKPPQSGSGPGNSPNAKSCQKGGWQNLYTSTGDSFASEKECTGYAAQGGHLSTTPYPESKALCESAGGTFTQQPWPYLWRCDDFSIGQSGDAGVETLFALDTACGADGGETGTNVVSVSEDVVIDSTYVCERP